MTDLEVAPVTTEDAVVLEEGDHEKLTHIVMPKSAVTEAYLTGTPVQALCGKMWVPTRDPEKFPICPTCKEILNEARARQGKPPI